jgi:uncharacterized protein (TIGR03790 family)
MVMRIDGPDEAIARRIITDSLLAEEQGLRGRFVIDSRGIQTTKPNGTPDAYGQYDQTLRNLARLVREKTSLQLIFDDRPEVIGKDLRVHDVALYVGWYSLRHYVPSMTFATGAVGFHVASLEMVTLHDDSETGWVHGLLTDGVVGTLGAVAEPYLHSFPKADEFFPLLMTGKLTLAETYWKTQMLTSWMTSCIGDPLYNPFKKNPALKVEDLPQNLRRAFDLPGAHQPAATTSSATQEELPFPGEGQAR